MYYARYQTATPLVIGPVIRATDGYSPLTLLTSASLNFFYWVGTGPTTGAYATAGCSGITEVASGYYRTFISSDMTNALGPGVICYETSGSSGLPMVDHYVVLAQHTYDALIKGTGTDLLQVDMQQIAGTTVGITAGGIPQSVLKYIGSTLTTVASGIMTTSATAFVSLLRYIGSSNTTVASGVMATSVNAFYVIDKYIGSSNTTFSSGVMSTSNSVMRVLVRNWGTSGTTVASGQMTTSLHAFNAVTLAVAASGTTVNSTFPWHQTSAQGFLSDVRFINQATMSTRTGDNIEAVYYNANATADTIWNDVGTGGGGGSSDVNVVQIGGSSAYMTTDGLIQVVAAFLGSSGSSMASGIMATSRHAFNSITLAVAASGTTVNSTFPWNQSSAQGFLADVRFMNQATMSTRTGENIEGAFYNAGATVTKIVNSLTTMTSASLSTFSTATPVDIGRIAGGTVSTRTADNIEAAFYNAGATATKIYNNIATLASAGISTLSTADLNNMSTLATANFNNMSTFGVSNVIDVWTFGDVMKAAQSHFVGIASFIGSGLTLYDNAGTTYIYFDIATNERTVTT